MGEDNEEEFSASSDDYSKEEPITSGSVDEEKHQSPSEEFHSNDDNRQETKNESETVVDSEEPHTDKATQNKIKLHRVAQQIRESNEIFLDQYHEPYAWVQINAHMELLDLYTKRFEHWVYTNLISYDSFNHPILPSPIEVTTVLDYLRANAEFNAPQKTLHLRVASIDEDSICYDLSNFQWQTVKILPQGWLIEDRPSVMFRRYGNQVAQVPPSREYDREIFDRFINLINVKDEDGKLLLKCYIIALLVPDIPKAILMLHGEPNSAKTTLMELIKMLIDPCVTRTLSCKRDNAELAQLLNNNYLPFFDNLSFIPDWMSDIFCKAVTGDSFTKRKLYSNNEDIFYSYMRCIGFSGVNLAATKADLLSRGLIIELQRILVDAQRQIKRIWKDFEEMKPQLLGYIFDIVASVVKKRATSKIDVKGLPRLADWAETCELISQCMGNKPDRFIDAFRRNIRLQHEAAIEDSPVAQAIIYLMENQTLWKGTPTDLLKQLNTFSEILSINTKNSKIWPSKPNILTRRLTYVKSILKEYDIDIRPGDDSTTKHKTLYIEKNVQKTSIQSIPSIQAVNHSQIASDKGIDEGIDTKETSIPQNEENHA